MGLIFSNKCCRCGLCCMSELCSVAMKRYGLSKHNPCPDLIWNQDGTSRCRLAEFTSPEELGIGAGCCIKARVLSVDKSTEIDYTTLPRNQKYDFVNKIKTGTIKLQRKGDE